MAANNNAGAWVLDEEVRRVYDGLNVIEERNGANASRAFYTRGTDMGGGGIGGLLAKSTPENTGTSHLFYHYDGRGNVVQLTDSTGATVAAYSYDAFGNTLSATGVKAGANLYRFSTKEMHPYSGLYDYGYRFYSPGLGKWINRDPIQEAGGLHLYGFVYNDPINLFDVDGRWVPLALAARALIARLLAPLFRCLAGAAVGAVIEAVTQWFLNNFKCIPWDTNLIIGVAVAGCLAGLAGSKVSIGTLVGQITRSIWRIGFTPDMCPRPPTPPWVPGMPPPYSPVPPGAPGPDSLPLF